MAVCEFDNGEDQFCDAPTGYRLCYRVHGHARGEPILLIAGLGLQLTYWSPRLIDGLVERGFRVITMDNRDAGRSSRAPHKPPSLWRQLTKRPGARAYTLEDMARDTKGVLDHLEVPRVHLVGVSMGGMIAQVLAAQHPDQTASLTSIFSTTGAGNVGQPAGSTLLKLAKAPPRGREEAVGRYLQIMEHIGSTAYPMNEQALRAYATQAWNRGAGEHAHEGVARQIGAIMKSGDRTAQVRLIKAPTLVVHGDLDRMVAHSGGVATANAIDGADLITIRGMGHFIADGVVPLLTDLIDGHARRSVERMAPSRAFSTRLA